MALRQLNHMKRFYKKAQVKTLENGLFGVVLDGKPVRSSGGQSLLSPSLQVAHIVSNEFNAQRDCIVTATMPMVI